MKLSTSHSAASSFRYSMDFKRFSFTKSGLPTKMISRMLKSIRRPKSVWFLDSNRWHLEMAVTTIPSPSSTSSCIPS
ncbi:hypothetical protein D3C71_1846970 [compost metagenome]